MVLDSVRYTYIDCNDMCIICRGIEFEIVVIDDNSPDGTQEVVAELQQAFGSDRCVAYIRMRVFPPPDSSIIICMYAGLCCMVDQESWDWGRHTSTDSRLLEVISSC